MKLLLIATLILNMNYLFAAESKPETVEKESKTKDEVKDEGDEPRKYVFVPGPSYTPSEKFGLMLIGMRLFDASSKNAKGVPPSTVSMFVKGTTNETYMGGLFSRLYLGEDTWRVEVGGFTGDIQSEMYQGDLDRFIGVSNYVTAARLSVSRRVWSDLFIGAGAQWNKVDFEASGSLVSQTENFGLNVTAFFDTRNNKFSPYDGFNLTFKTNFYRESFGGDDDIDIFQLKYTHYKALQGNKNRVFSWLVDSNFSFGDTNPSYNYNYGARGPRGYTGKVYEGKNMLRLEGEYKHYFESILKSRFGVAGFAGIGKVFGGTSRIGNDIPDSFSDGDLLPHGGVGIRYRLIPKQNLNSRVDIAYGREKEFTMYFALQEAI